MRLVAIGCSVGLAVALALVPKLTGHLFETSPTDALAWGSALATVLLITLRASLFPAQAAARLDPLQALREE